MSENIIKNPILKGFNPDPSVLRVGEDYYIATSTFEWFPGVQIHHSKDLIHWELLTRPLDRVSQLDLRGIPQKGGVWAPCLSYDNGLFYLVYTIVFGDRGLFKDLDNFLVTATDITGPWSEPIYLNSTGFDPSLFHDEDGRKWLVNMVWDYRKGHPKFGGILLQEYDPAAKKLTGPVKNIYPGTELGTTEGPHLYRRNGYYYLMTAEGGTGYNHTVSMARSELIDGPYENDPSGPVLTARFNPDHPLQKAGHADLVETQKGAWYMVHLASRPFEGTRDCIMGRETCIQKVRWTPEGWLRMESGGILPEMAVPAPDLPQWEPIPRPERDDFESPLLNIQYQTLYGPLGPDRLSLTERKGWLRLKGGPSFSSGSAGNISLIARRQQSWRYTAETLLEFEPDSYRQMAGLICIHDIENFLYLRVSRNGDNKVIGIISCENKGYAYPAEDVTIPHHQAVKLRVEVDGRKLQFFYSLGAEFTAIGPAFDTVLLTDDHSTVNSYTGAMVGLCCQDVARQNAAADFDYFLYSEQ